VSEPTRLFKYMTEIIIDVIIFRIFVTVAECDGLMHGSPIYYSHPGYITWPIATFVNYVYTVKITQ
jgi:hypothetical protein